MKAHGRRAEGLSFRFWRDTGLRGHARYPSPVLSQVTVPPEFRTLIYPVLVAGVLILAKVSLPLPTGIDLGRMFFWTVITVVLAALPVRLPGGVVAHTATAPLIACAFDPGLANPF